MTRKLAIPVLLVALLVPASAASAARVPPDFVGISPQNPANKDDFALMRAAGLRSVRLPLYWIGVAPHSPYLVAPNWDEFDRSVKLATEHGMKVFPFIWGTPPWVAAQARTEPAYRGWTLGAWSSFLRQAVHRYGPRGSFWRENPELPRMPIRMWELWNEPNIISFSANSNARRFTRLLRAGGRAIHRADRGAKVILGGLFGRPLQIPPNVGSSEFLDRVYRAGRIKRSFDGVGLHPYVADASAMRPQIRGLRRVMRRHGDARTPLYLTELGWGSDSFQTRWERGLRGQARELDQAFAMIAKQRRNWRIGGVWWFSWADIKAGCQFCDSAGLLTEHREAKPAWYRFNAWTGGNPDVVPRARFDR